MNRTLITAALLAIGLSACGNSPAAQDTAAAKATSTTTAVTAATGHPAAGTSVAVKAGSSPLGQILVDEGGNTLYAFTNDTDAKSTCTGTCAEAWPPVIVDASWTVAPGLDSGVFSTVVRDDGGEQLMAGKFPLYRFSGDARPGDVNGQKSGGVWFVVDTKAAIIEAAAADKTPAPSSETSGPAVDVTQAPAAALVTVADNPLGQLLTDADGRTLYGFAKDADGTSTCVDGCATAWPPVIVDASFDLSTLPTSASFSVIDRPDGSKQLKAGKWPLYRFSGDEADGETNGQGSGGNWFVVGADAKLIK
jgi:predicted lipoprotein with Yx(FWY)xxD motif